MYTDRPRTRHLYWSQHELHLLLHTCRECVSVICSFILTTPFLLIYGNKYEHRSTREHSRPYDSIIKAFHRAIKPPRLCSFENGIRWLKHFLFHSWGLGPYGGSWIRIQKARGWTAGYLSGVIETQVAGHLTSRHRIISRAQCSFTYSARWLIPAFFFFFFLMPAFHNLN